MQQIFDLISQPWPWYVAGIMIALVMAVMLWFGESFGFSSNLRTICSMGGAGKVSSFFNFNWKGQMWNIMFLTGTVLGGYASGKYLSADIRPDISPDTVTDLQEIGISSGATLNPEQLFGAEALSDPKIILILLTGGFLVGFGSRYAGGCTSGHAISGLSDLQLPSLIAVIGFFIGGLTMTHFLLPLIF